MSKVINNNGFNTKLKDDQFLRIVENSTMGVAIIQRGFLKYCNPRFQATFGYSHEEIASWKKFEYFKIIHPDDVPLLLEKMKIEDRKNVSVRFRGVKKNGDIINIENYICRIKYKDKFGYLSSYIMLDNSLKSG
ncbi:MAG: PAS domain-containing protein [Candidatus Thorarchaeota archaeon]